MGRIRTELRDIQRDIVDYCSAGLEKDNDLYKWRLILLGAEDTSYKNGLFSLNLIFPKDYPKSSPKIVFLTPIYHPNVNCKNDRYIQLGNVCVSFLNCWRPETTAKELLIKLFSIFYWPNPDCGYNSEILDEIRHNRPLYESKVRYFTKKYANPMRVRKSYDKTWDFTCDEKDLKFVEIKEEEKILKSNNNDENNYLICVNFLDSGRDVIIVQCMINDLASDVIQKFVNKSLNSCNYQSLYIYNRRQINMNATLKENGICNYSKIYVIKDVFFC